MYDHYNRKINYLRISVTDRCNLRCTYCMPEEGIILKKHNEILRFEEIIEIVQTGAKLGISKIRITGGEPLIRKDLPELISNIWKTKGIEDVGLTTNGILLERDAGKLKEAGLKRINVSLDTINPEKYMRITRHNKLDAVISGLLMAKKLGLNPIKINFVRIKGVNEDDEKQVKKFCARNDFEIRFIKQMDLSTGQFYPVEGGSGGICSNCNRIRLTADGNIVPCLFSDYGYSIKELGIESAFYRALENKPLIGKVSVNRQFYNIGG